MLRCHVTVSQIYGKIWGALTVLVSVCELLSGCMIFYWQKVFSGASMNFWWSSSAFHFWIAGSSCTSLHGFLFLSLIYMLQGGQAGRRRQNSCPTMAFLPRRGLLHSERWQNSRNSQGSQTRGTAALQVCNKVLALQTGFVLLWVQE